ncbi:hypothetical protein like AT3G25270 [Hibiscus trionum]|uniref:Reverse transcriptase zinc-binding domain n=1 Tax=Hibiscus trionum TaxID=183268 RepID=A0A9W7IJQ7_HIBTR|nr:hypothetical protein like AT3G25270 [Hibiscus trionum]
MILVGDPNVHNSDWLGGLFNSIWSAKVPPKVSIAAWRFIMNYVPTFSNLSMRRISISHQCLLCSDATETNVHLISDCVFVKSVCAGLGITLPFRSTEQDWLFWLSLLFKGIIKSQQRTLVVIYWAIWQTRNQKLHENRTKNPVEVIQFVSSYLHELDGLDNISHQPSAQSPSQWQPPAPNSFKVNFDASYDKATATSVSGGLVRDADGLIMAAFSCPNRFVRDPEAAEAIACFQAISFAKDAGFRRIVAEGDSLVVCSKINRQEQDLSRISPIIFSIKEKAKGFESITFVHVRRELNRAAHALARFGKSFSSTQIWLEEAPPVVEEAALIDRWWVNPPD